VPLWAFDVCPQGLLLAVPPLPFVFMSMCVYLFGKRFKPSSSKEKEKKKSKMIAGEREGEKERRCLSGLLPDY